MSRNSKTSVQGSLLSDLLSGLDIVSELLTLPPYAGRRHNVEARIAQEDWDRVYGADVKKRRALSILRARKQIQDTKKGQEVIVQISTSAIAVALKERIISKEGELKNEEVCIVAFDFPVGSSKARDKWRHLLKVCGFTREQLSIYTSPKAITEEIKAHSKVVGVEDWVKVYQARVI